MSDRIAELEARISRLEAVIERLVPKPTALELAFPGRWEKRWSGKGTDWDASGTEVFEVRGLEIAILETTTGARARWQCGVTVDGDSVRIEQSHPSRKSGLAPITVELKGNAEQGYTGTERVGEHNVTVTYAPFTGELKPRQRKRPRPTTREEWVALAAERRTAKIQKVRDRSDRRPTQ